MWPRARRILGTGTPTARGSRSSALDPQAVALEHAAVAEAVGRVGLTPACRMATSTVNAELAVVVAPGAGDVADRPRMGSGRRSPAATG